MELFNQAESRRRQEKIVREAQPLAEAVLARAGAYPDLADQLHLLGTTVLPLLRAGHHLVTEGLGTARADQWLGEHLGILAALISDGSGRSLTISVSSTPKS
jgi:hypothetical protein